jgi:D-amino-acid dehydrogenase
MKVGVIGGGIIGLCSAYYLKKAGHDVLVFDQSSLEDGCSFGNAGMVVPSHIIPLAAPGMIAKGFRWMFNNKSPFYVKPRLSLDLLKWGWLFYLQANADHVAHAAPALKELSLFSKTQYQQLAREVSFDFGYHERGLLMLYQSAEAEHEETETAHLANQQGIHARMLTPSEVQAMEPDVRVSVRGGVFYPGDAHLTPQLLIRGLIDDLKKQGVVFHASTSVTGFDFRSGRVRALRAGAGEYPVDELVLAAGSWSPELAHQLQLNLPMQAGKGYSFTEENVKRNIRIPSILLEARVAVTTMGNSIRFGGTMEITGIDHAINLNRVRGIVEAVPRYYDLQPAMPAREKIWHGLRPCSPDGLPYIGRLKSLPNVIIATGHAMMGLSLGPGTGKLVAEIVQDQVSFGSLEVFRPDRFS